MQARIFSRAVTAWIAGSALLWLGAQAQTPPIADRAVVEERIQDELLPILDEAVNEQQYAQLYGIEYPVEPPKRSFEQVQRLAAEHIDKLVMAEYPDSWVQQQYAKLAHQHRQWRLGERVRVKLDDGRSFTDVLRERNPTNILIGPRRFHFSEIHPDSLDNLDPQRGREAKERTLRRLQHKLGALRFELRQDLRLQKEAEIYHKEGYIRVRGKWMSVFAFFRDLIQAKRQEFDDFLRPSLEYKHYYNAGYRLHDGVWYAPDEVLVAETDTARSAEAAAESGSGGSGFGDFARKLGRFFGGGDEDTDSGSDTKAAPAKPGGQLTAGHWVLFAFGIIAALAVVYALASAVMRKLRR